MTHGALPDPDDPTPGAHIHGWMAPLELRWLHETAKTMSSIVEVGTNRGRSAYALASGCPGSVYCVDLWDDPGDHGYRAFMENLAPLGNVVPVRGRSPEVAASVLQGPVDMVFIDGDHEYGSVIADIDGWLHLTRKLICGHDFYLPLADANHPGVARAVMERFDGEYQIAPDTSIWYVEL